MSFVEITVPAKAKSSRESSISPEDMKQILKLLKESKAVSDDVVYDKPSKSGKMDARNVAYYAGFRVRDEVIATGEYSNKDLRLETFADDEVENGWRWALRRK
jgi:hypothetical protein